MAKAIGVPNTTRMIPPAELVTAISSQHPVDSLEMPIPFVGSATGRSAMLLARGSVCRHALSGSQVCPVPQQKDSGEHAPEDDSDQLRASSGFCRR